MPFLEQAFRRFWRRWVGTVAFPPVMFVSNEFLDIPRPVFFVLFFLAVPSAAPQCYFDESGTFQGWVRDPGDMKTPKRFLAIGDTELISFDEAANRIEARKTAGQTQVGEIKPKPVASRLTSLVGFLTLSSRLRPRFGLSCLERNAFG